jgi:ComF family protein
MWDYAAESAYLVQQLKFGQKLNFAKLMGDLLAETLQKAYQQEPWPQVMIAVPLHRKRLFERGFNQSLELAKVLQRQLTIPCDYRSALRLRHTPAQSLLPAAARRRNLHKAFSVQLTRPYQHVVIVDDVITTLSTAQELAKSLLAAGVKRVDVWSCIRTQDSKISRG